MSTAESFWSPQGPAMSSARVDGLRGESAESVARRFWPKVNKTEACWLWTGFRAPYNGYGKIKVGGKRGLAAQAHRVSWELHNGPVPIGMTVHHRCDVPACVNPAHLWVGTHAENMDDRNRKGRQSSRLCPADVLAIRASTETAKALASRYGLRADYISAIRRRVTWKHV